jgi:uncharacterized DUF497 family protein
MSEETTEDPFAHISAFEWDEQKRRSNLREHKIDFLDAQRVIDEPIFIRRSDRKSEIRFVVYGFVDAREVVVICTFRGERCRLISARRARRDERKKYHSRLPRPSEAGQD